MEPVDIAQYVVTEVGEEHASPSIRHQHLTNAKTPWLSWKI
ncbi:hypothetical protein HMPREF1861_01420 [Corynebacterium kroppenstedtii]|nr:hypothetical protein HMPREF1861_01420 [Corynebacterium kroppenstedtii]